MWSGSRNVLIHYVSKNSFEMWESYVLVHEYIEMNIRGSNTKMCVSLYFHAILCVLFVLFFFFWFFCFTVVHSQRIWLHSLASERRSSLCMWRAIDGCNAQSEAREIAFNSLSGENFSWTSMETIFATLTHWIVLSNEAAIKKESNPIESARKIVRLEFWYMYIVFFWFFFSFVCNTENTTKWNEQRECV